MTNLPKLKLDKVGAGSNIAQNHSFSPFWLISQLVFFVVVYLFMCVGDLLFNVVLFCVRKHCVRVSVDR